MLAVSLAQVDQGIKAFGLRRDAEGAVLGGVDDSVSTSNPAVVHGDEPQRVDRLPVILDHLE